MTTCQDAQDGKWKSFLSPNKSFIGTLINQMGPSHDRLHLVSTTALLFFSVHSTMRSFLLAAIVCRLFIVFVAGQGITAGLLTCITRAVLASCCKVLATAMQPELLPAAAGRTQDLCE